jgi:hypothetical protein
MPPKSVFRLTLGAFAAALLSLLGVTSLAGQRGTGGPREIDGRVRLAAETLQIAPGELGSARSGGSLFVLTDAKGKEVLLFDSATGELTSYLETGEGWGKPTRLVEHNGEPFAPQAFRVQVDGDQVAFAWPLGVALFKRETGELTAEDRSLDYAADVEAMPGGGWVVDRTRPPIPALERVDHERFGGVTPRLVVVDDKLKVSRYGLAAESGRTPNASAARTLRLAASDNRLYAVELANYKVYEFDRRLKQLATFIEPKLQLEKGVGATPDIEIQRHFRAEAQQVIDRAGKDAGRPASGGEVQSTFFTYQAVVRDIAWDARARQLVLLIAPGITNDLGALDLLDPATGEVRRLLLRLPESASRVELSQLAIGFRYLWLRGHPGDGPTLRLDRETLAQAKAVRAVVELKGAG